MDPTSNPLALSALVARIARAALAVERLCHLSGGQALAAALWPHKQVRGRYASLLEMSLQHLQDKGLSTDCGPRHLNQKAEDRRQKAVKNTMLS
jgi:hypothetical protein